MKNYLVSARKYRPDTFMSVVGQKALTTTLQNAIKNHQVAQGYLFCGPRGVGKTTCARIFAKAINCTNPHPDGEACNECESCRSFNEQRSLNIFELDAASNNSVDDIRLLTEQVRIPPQLGKYKVYIIDEVHMLSTGAFNAFLKTLEEPPSHAVFILATTEKHKIPATILSRCQIYDFHRIGVGDIQEYLQYVATQEGIEFEPEALNVIAMKADGGMRDALSIFDQVASFGEGRITYNSTIANLNVLDYDYFFRLIDFCLQKDVSNALLLFDEVLNQGFEGMHFVSGLCSHLRDLMVCQDPRTLKLLEVSDSIREQYARQAQSCSFDFLLNALRLANECSLQYPASKNKRLSVELLLIRLCHPDSPSPDDKKTTVPPIGQTRTSPTMASGSTSTAGTPSSGVRTSPAPISASTDTVRPTVSASIPKPVSTPSPVNSLPNATPPSTHIPGAQKPKTFSLKKTKAAAEEAQVEVQNTVVEKNEAYSQEQFSAAWKEYAGRLKEDPQLYVAVTTDEPVPLGNDRFEFVVFQTHTGNQMNALKHDIESFLHEKLQNTHIALSIRVSEGDEKKKALSSQDQLNEMIKDQPAIAQLKQSLLLEID